MAWTGAVLPLTVVLSVVLAGFASALPRGTEPDPSSGSREIQVLPPASNGLPASPVLSPTVLPPGAASKFDSAEATLQQRYTTDLQQFVAEGAPARLVHLPSSEPTEVVDGAVVPGPEYAAEVGAQGDAGPTYATGPAPAGIAYYGESGNASNPAPTVVDTTSLAGTLNVTNLTALYLDTDNPDQWGAQLNAVVTNVTLWGSRGTAPEGYAYWAQDVVGYQQFNHTLQFVENTWNFTTSSSSVPLAGAGTFVANSTNDSLDYGLAIGRSQYLYAPTPFNLTLYLNLSLNNPLICGAWSSLRSSPSCSDPANAVAAYRGDQTLFYNYSLSFPPSNNEVRPGTRYAGSFDWLTFHTSASGAEDNGSNVRSAGFEASGSQPGAVVDDDFELDFGIGAFDGANQDVFSASGTATLDYVNDCSKPSGLEATCTPPLSPEYQSVPAAFDFGSETGETTNGLEITYDPTTDVATFSAGPLSLHPLWGYTDAGGSSPGATPVTNDIEVSGSPLVLSAQPYVFIFLNDTSVPSPFPNYAWAPDVRTWYLMPGTYDYLAMLADYTEQSGSFTVGSAPVTVAATLSYAPSNGVYTPLWAVEPGGNLANAELAGISSSGAGTVGSPYLLFNNPDSATGAELNSEFFSLNDYSWPTYAGTLLWNTTSYVDDQDEVSFFAGTLYDGLHTASAYLQQELYQTQHVTVADTTILGWPAMDTLFGLPAAQNPIPQGDLVVWNSTDDLVMGNTFPAEKPIARGWVAPDELLLYGGGGECSAAYGIGPGPGVDDPCGGESGPLPPGSQNVIWGNTFCDPPAPVTGRICPVGSLRSPGTYAGLAEAESGDLVYNNAFTVDNPAPLMAWDLETETGPVHYYDTWNVSEQAASDIARVVNGVSLSGDVLNGANGTTYALQGGNYWWNYGTRLNPRSSPEFLNVVDYTRGVDYLFPGMYTSNDQAGILGPGDGSPLGKFATTFRESGLPGGTTWWVNVTLPGQVTPYSLSSTTSSRAALYLSDGTYTYTTASSNKEYAARGGSFTVVGKARSVKITFILNVNELPSGQP